MDSIPTSGGLWIQTRRRRLFPHLQLILLSGSLFLFLASSGRAAILPPGFSEMQFGGVGANMAYPTAMAFAPDGRLFICTQLGSLRVIRNGVLLDTAFLTVPVDFQGERGLLGVAFDPNFETNQFVYVYYTTLTSPIHNRVSRFTADGDVAAPGSEVVILELDDLSTATNHNGGAIHFGPDGMLYIATGENANTANSQTLANLLGKVLRIDPSGSIPADNPFFNQAAGKNRAIWALGFRNPFTFSFQLGTGRLFINDVGQSTWEEINDGIAGANYGWPICEGDCNPPDPAFVDPVFQYIHDGATCAITGGDFYNPTVQVFPLQYRGQYFFADYCAGWIHMLDPATHTVNGFASGLSFPVDLQVGPDGALYYLQQGNGGQVWRVSSNSSKYDFDGDGKSDPAVWRGSTGQWFILKSSDGAPQSVNWGLQSPPFSDVPVPGDYDGDGKTDIAVWRPGNGIWYVLSSGIPGTYSSTPWGLPTDIPVPADYDGDGKTDIAVWRPDAGFWYILPSESPGTFSVTHWGLATDKPVPADYDGDGKTDMAVWRPDAGFWYILPSESPGTFSVTHWGLATDKPAPADYDGDGKGDVTVWRPENGVWYVLPSSGPAGTFQAIQWGLSTDIPASGDYDGDGITDPAVWRPAMGTWYLLPSASPGSFTSTQWGLPSDIPISP